MFIFKYLSSRIYGFYLSADKIHVFTNSQIRPNLQTTRRLLSADKILFADPPVELDSVCRFFFVCRLRWGQYNLQTSYLQTVNTGLQIFFVVYKHNDRASANTKTSIWKNKNRICRLLTNLCKLMFTNLQTRPIGLKTRTLHLFSNLDICKPCPARLCLQTNKLVTVQTAPDLQTIHTYLQTRTAVCKFWHSICKQE